MYFLRIPPGVGGLGIPYEQLADISSIDDASIQQNNLVALPPGTLSEMTFSLSIFKLRRIAGRIIQLLYCSAQNDDNRSSLVNRFVMELEAWRLTIPTSNKDATDESIVPSVFKSSNYFTLGYWHARLLLYRLLAPGGSPQGKTFNQSTLYVELG